MTSDDDKNVTTNEVALLDSYWQQVEEAVIGGACNADDVIADALDAYFKHGTMSSAVITWGLERNGDVSKHLDICKGKVSGALCNVTDKRVRQRLFNILYGISRMQMEIIAIDYLMD
jgi:hypothetical protein